MISDIAPGSGETDVSVFTTPQATFTTTIGEQFEADDGNGVSTYRVQLKSFSVNNEDGKSIDGKLEWNKERNAVSFRSKDVLPPNTTLTAKVEVSFDRLSGGAWKTVVTAGQQALESMESTFTTGGAPDYIPLENVVYCYPVVDQQYFMTEESSKGFVQLQMGQQYLFEQGFDYKLVFLGDNNQNVSADFTYSDARNRIEYTIPRLANERRYTLQLVYTPQATDGGTVSERTQSQELLSDGEDGSVAVGSRDAVAGVNVGTQKSILDYGFIASRWSTFRQKIESINTEGNGIAEDAGISYRFLYDVVAEEAFDEAEVTGVRHSDGKALVSASAGLGEPYFTEEVNPLVYDGYPFGNIRLKNRDEQTIGVPPVRSVYIYRPYLDLIADGGRPKRFIFPFSYEANIVAERDFLDLRQQIANNRQSVPADVYSRFLTSRFYFIKYGKYKVVLRYVLPDGTVTSSYDFYFNNFLLFNE
jgi:opacity protein-like surface antigen